MFALGLPLPEYPAPVPLPSNRRGADLILPWEHRTRDQLLLTKHLRFKRSKEEELVIHEFLNDRLHAKLSGRSERRYRRPTSSDTHVNALIHLALAHVVRYTDALRAGGSWRSDQGRFSLETLSHANSLEEAGEVRKNVYLPTPSEVWEARRKEFGGWPPLLSVRFPNLRQWEDKIVRLAKGSQIAGLAPVLGPGSLLLLKEISSIPDARIDRAKSGWSRPIYVIRRGLEIICGYLERNGDQYVLHSGVDSGVKGSFHAEDLSQLRRVTGVAVPV